MRSSSHFISRKPKCSPCPKCGALCFVGIDEGIPFKVDSIPISLDGEIVARMNGRLTYQLQIGYMMQRDQWRMRADLRHGRGRVFATHVCDDSLLWAIDAQQVSYIVGYIETLSQPREEITIEEEHAVTSIMDLLAGRVIAVYDSTAPF